MTTDVRTRRYQFDLAALQRLAAVNYAALAKLVSGIPAQQIRTVKAGRNLRFTLEVTDAAPYTTEIRIQQQALSQQLPGLKEAQMDVRLYHDAQLAEVIRSQGIARLRPYYPQPNRDMYQADEKHQVNYFLQEWLQLLSRTGMAQEG